MPAAAGAVHRQLCRLAEKRRYAGQYFPAVSLFITIGLSQRYFVVSLQPVLHGGLRSGSCSACLIPKAIQPGFLNGFRAQFRFLRERHLRHLWLDAAARDPRCAGYGFRPILHTGTVLGMLNGKYLCIPEKTRMNGNLAVYGASGSMKPAHSA